LQFFMNLIQGDFGEAMDNFADMWGVVGDAIGNVANVALDGLESVLEDIGQDIKDLGKSIGKKLKEGVKDTLALGGVAVDAIKEMGSSFAEGIKKIASDIAQFGADIGNTLIDAINNAIPDRIGFDVPKIKVAGQTVFGGGNVGVDLPDDPLANVQTGGFISEGGLANLHAGERVVPAAQVEDRGMVEVEQSGGGPIKVVVEGDTGVIEDVTAERIEEEQRRAKRNTGGSTQI